MIARVTFLDKNDKEYKMLFGDSYKTWDAQLKEYIGQHVKWWDSGTIMQCDIQSIVKVEISLWDWISFGGLKWCSHETFQQELNREGCQENEPDNLHPRKYSDIESSFDNAFLRKVKIMFNQRLRHLKRKTFSRIQAEVKLNKKWMFSRVELWNSTNYQGEKGKIITINHNTDDPNTLYGYYILIQLEKNDKKIKAYKFDDMRIID